MATARWFSFSVVPLATVAILSGADSPPRGDSPRRVGAEFAVSFGSSVLATPVDGRVLFVLSTDDGSEP